MRDRGDGGRRGGTDENYQMRMGEGGGREEGVEGVK